MYTVMDNDTLQFSNITSNSGHIVEKGSKRWIHLVITLVFFIGVVGNLAALWILHRSARNRNKKHVLMLRCLAINDLVAEIGMFIVLVSPRYINFPKYWVCVGFVLLRAFGLGSGCVAFVMALERWLALTRPFYYQKWVTYKVVKRLVLFLWCVGALLTYLPFFGFGLYYKDDKCARYREATELMDKIYAYVFLAFGSTLCFFIAICNLTVICELSKFRPQSRVLVRRVSKSAMQNKIGSNVKNHTPEEVAFAKLMAIICIIFVMCWAPQMISIPVAQFYRGSTFDKIFSPLANVLMGVYFTLDPYVYVLQRYFEKNRSVLKKCFFRSKGNPRSSSTISMTSTTPNGFLLNSPSTYTSQTVM